MMDDWLAARIKENVPAYRAGYEAAGLDCHNMFMHIMHGPLRQKWIGQMVDALLALCEAEDWDNARDRGRLDGFMDIKDGVYASPDPS